MNNFDRARNAGQLPGTITADAVRELPPNIESIPLGHDKAGNPIVGLVPTIPVPTNIRTRGEAYEYLYLHFGRQLRKALAAEWHDSPGLADAMVNRLFPMLWLAYNMTPQGRALEAAPASSALAFRPMGTTLRT